MRKSPEAVPPKSVAGRNIFWIAAYSVLIIGIAFLLRQSNFLPFRPTAVRDDTDARHIQPDDLLSMQKTQNALLAAELDRLRLLMPAEPCAIPDLQREPLGKKPYRVFPGAPAAPTSPSSPAAAPDHEKTAPHEARSAVPSAEPSSAESASKKAATPAETVGDVVEQATVLVLSNKKTGVSVGTGFFVGPGIVLTNRHVADAATTECFVTNKTLGRMTQAQLLTVGKEEARDYALLKINDNNASSITPLRFDTGIKRADRVSAWGFPGAVSQNDPHYQALLEGDASAVPEIVYSDGAVSVFLMNREPPVIEHTAMISHGNSGGPLVDESGNVVGINTMISLDDKSYRQMGISLAAVDIIRFLEENGIKPQLSNNTR